MDRMLLHICVCATCFQAEYDDYVGWLLDTHPTQSHILREQVNDLYDKRVSNPAQLQKVKRDTQELENQGKRLLNVNDKLRADVRQAREAEVTSSPGMFENKLHRNMRTRITTVFDMVYVIVVQSSNFCVQ